MYDTWVLTDERIGSSKQAIALADILKRRYQEKKLHYNILGKLPSILKTGLMDLTQESIKSLSEPIPKFVISCGRRSARIAVELKRKNQNCKIITILKPDLDFENFDLVILPNHDKTVKLSKLDNVLFIDGALVSNQNITVDRDLLIKLNKFPSPIITGLLGGKSKSCNLNESHVKEFIHLLIRSAQHNKATLFISNSRRTGIKNTELVKNILKESKIPYYFYDVFSEEINPYHVFLKKASLIVLTGDSISMCSEVLNTKKPVYIYHKDKMLGDKHKRFIDHLMKNNFAKSCNFHKIQKFQPAIFNQTDLIYKKILKLLKKDLS